MSNPACTSNTTTTPTPQPFTTTIFTSTMAPLSDLSHYPPYCRRGGANPKSNPILRSRKIFDHGTKMPAEKSCTNCLKLGVDCIRYDDKFSKCCWCTAEDIHPVGMCHVQGVEEPETGGLSMTARGKKRRVDMMLDTEKIPAPAGVGQSQFEIEAPNKAAKKSSEHRNPRPQIVADSESENMSLPTMPPLKQQPSKLDSDANVERTAALEDKVNVLEDKVIELQGKIDELISSSRLGQKITDLSADDSIAGGVKPVELGSSGPATEAVEMAIDEPVTEETIGSETTTCTLAQEEGDKAAEHITFSLVNSSPVDLKLKEPGLLPGLLVEKDEAM